MCYVGTDKLKHWRGDTEAPMKIMDTKQKYCKNVNKATVSCFLLVTNSNLKRQVNFAEIQQ